MEFRFRQVRRGEGFQGNVRDTYVLELVDEGRVYPLLRLYHNIEYSIDEVPLQVEILHPELLELTFGRRTCQTCVHWDPEGYRRTEGDGYEKGYCTNEKNQTGTFFRVTRHNHICPYWEPVV